MEKQNLPSAGKSISLEQTEGLWAHVHLEKLNFNTKLKWKDKQLLTLFDWLLIRNITTTVETQMEKQ